MSPIINTQIANVTNNTSRINDDDNNNNNKNSNMMEERYYESIIFSGPIIFALIILFLLYFLYLRRQSVDWSSLRMRQSRTIAVDVVSEVGLKKEFRELLPIIVYKESFSVNDTQCSVCLGDYQAEDRLQQIPGCGHTFHLSCIDHWLSTHTTCPLCRLSLISSSKDPPTSCPESPSETDNRVNNLDGVLQTRLQIF